MYENFLGERITFVQFLDGFSFRIKNLKKP